MMDELDHLSRISVVGSARVLITALIIIASLTSPVNAQTYESERKALTLYRKAKNQSIIQKWDKAITLFQKLLDTYPESNYADDALFWTGYCLEKRQGTEIEAFFTFEDLLDQYPESSWVDDAVVHQISIAEKLIRGGNPVFKDFLIQKMNEDAPTIQQHAAIALGRLGDSAALPVLKAMKEDEELSTLVVSLIQWIESGKPDEEQIEPVPPDQPGLRFEIASGLTSDEPETEPEKGLIFSFSKRYKQYRRMLKMGETWTRDELIDFALWQVLDTEAFETYSSLTDYDRQEWLRKYWKSKDLTPTTDLNEAQEEFERRIEYARSQFSDLWDFRHSRFLKDQHLRPDIPHAPWDARGELYIKYGEPDFIMSGGYLKDEWIYDRSEISTDFIVHRYKTNIYGEALEPGPRSKFIYAENPKIFDAEYLYKQDFRFSLDLESKSVKKIEIYFDREISSDGYGIVTGFMLPLKELKPVKAQNQFTVRFLHRLIVFDEDFNEIFRNEDETVVHKPAKNGFKKKDRIFSKSFTLDLEPGQYTVAIRIEDQNDDRVGILKKTFDLKR